MIFEAIAAVKIANEAIGAIKEFAGHIQSVGEMGPQLTKLADAKEELEKKAKDGSMEHFFELEKIKQKEAEIKQLFIYSGRPGLWEDYQKFLANRKQLKENERKRIEQAKARKKRLIKEWSIGIAVTLAVLSAVGICAYFLYWLIATKGQ
jgi:ethanolamine utilization microcompartment shell protein EutS